MCRYEQTLLPSRPDSPRQARSWVARQLSGWHLDELADDLRLCASELVTNVVLHARTPAVLTLCVADGVLEMSVGDANRRSPRPRVRHDDPLSESGRGMSLVDQLADEWGFSERAGGKDVWLLRRLAPGWPTAVPCPCTAGTPPGWVSAAGRRVAVPGADG